MLTKRLPLSKNIQFWYQHRTVMNCYESFRVLFVIQNLFGLKHYRWDRNADKLFIDKRIIGASWTLFTILLTSFLSYIGYFYKNFDASTHRNPIDKGLLTTFVTMTSMMASIMSVFIVWFLSIWNCQKECRFYQELKQLDETLFQKVDLQPLYKQFHQETKIVGALVAVPNIIGFIMLYFSLHGVIYKVANFILTLFIVQYTCTSIFCLNLRALQLRFNLIRKESKKRHTQKHYATLVDTTKTLTKLLKHFNESFGLKQGPILFINFFNATTYSYSLFLAWTIREKTHVHYLYIVMSIKVMLPHLLMITMVFVMGDFVKMTIRFTSYALGTTDDFKVRHLQRRLLLNLKSVTSEVCILDLVSLNLKVMAKGLNLVAMYFVIILQFNILTEDFLV